jgi:hypothetical protein
MPSVGRVTELPYLGGAPSKSGRLLGPVSLVSGGISNHQSQQHMPNPENSLSPSLLAYANQIERLRQSSQPAYVRLFLGSKSVALIDCAGMPIERARLELEAQSTAIETIEALPRSQQDRLAGRFDGIADAIAFGEFRSRDEDASHKQSLETVSGILGARNRSTVFCERHPLHWYYRGKESGFREDAGASTEKLRKLCKDYRWSTSISLRSQESFRTKYHMLGLAAVALELIAIQHCR